MLLFFGCFFAINLFAATYDLSGTWNYTISDNWAVGGIKCEPGPDTYGTCVIEQSGDTFSFAFISGVTCSPPESCTFAGSIAGTVYTCSTTDIVDDENGSVTSTIVFNASSDTSASGTGTSRYTHPSDEWECNWGNTIALTKSDSAPGGIYNLSVKTNGSGSVDPTGGPYAAGTIVQLTATADAGWQFDNWTGDVAEANAASTTVTMDADKTVTANFAQSDEDSADDEADTSNTENDDGGGGGGGGGCFVSALLK